ncbi:MAG TPA: hypothetical protein PKY31_13710 [Spirochaetota bacterium]|nr:hypothetical protein [Spirochaetota bacterium]
MDDRDIGEFESDIERCRNCDGEILKRIGPDGSASVEDARCLLCDRFYRQGRLFLNNVG